MRGHLQLRHSWATPSAHSSSEEGSPEVLIPSTFPACTPPHRLCFFGNGSSQPLSRSFAYDLCSPGFLILCLSLAILPLISHFLFLNYVVSYHFMCPCVLPNHVIPSLKAYCVLIFFVVLAVQITDLNFRVLEPSSQTSVRIKQFQKKC